MTTHSDDAADAQRLRGVLEQLQELAWQSLWISVRRDAAFQRDSSGHALAMLLHILEEQDSIDIDRMDVELLSSGVYEAVMRRAAKNPDGRVRDQHFKESASREFTLDEDGTLWDSAPHFAEVVEDIRTFDSSGRGMDLPRRPRASAE